VRASAALLLLLLAASPIAVGAESLEKLVANLDSKDPTVRSSAWTELRSRSDPKAIPLLLAALPEYSFWGRYYGAMVFDAYPPKLAKLAWRSLAKSADPYLRLCAGAGLIRNGEPKGAELVIRALKAEGQDSNTRMYMLNKLMSVRNARVAEAVRAFLRADEEPRLIGVALYVLSLQTDRGAIPACTALLEAPEAGVRAMAAAYLFRLGDESFATRLATEIRSGEVAYTEFSRITSLLRGAPRVPDEVLDAVTELLESEKNPSLLMQAVRLVAQYRHRKAIPALQKLLRHKSSMVAKAAFEALSEMPGALDEGKLLPLLDSEDPDRRLQAAHALRRMGNETGFAVVLEVLTTEKNATHRREAARILGGFRRDASVEPLLDALLDTDPSVRSYALTGLTAVLQALFPMRRLNLRTTGYAHSAPEAARRAAVETLRAWWLANRDKDW